MRGSNWLSLAVPTLLLGACAGSLPPRYVIEHDLGPYAYRRYQKSLDIEVPIADNTATGHTASYLRRGAKDEVAVVTAFVTVYKHAKSLTAEARAALQNLAGYALTTSELAGEHVWLLEAAGRERWCVWVSAERLVKIGVQPGQEFPEPIVDAYLDVYPSDLNERGVAREDAPSAGPAKLAADGDEPELGLPQGLRENAPR